MASNLPERGYASSSRGPNRSVQADLHALESSAQRISGAPDQSASARIRPTQARRPCSCSRGSARVATANNLCSGQPHDRPFTRQRLDLYDPRAFAARAGLNVDVSQLGQTNRANFDGTFIFGSDVMRNALGVRILDASGAPTVISGLHCTRRRLRGFQVRGRRGTPSARRPGGDVSSLHRRRLCPRTTGRSGRV